MRITNASLANYAEVRAGLAYIVGAFPEWWEVPAVPFGVSIYCVAVLELDPSEVDKPLGLEVLVRRPNDQVDPIARIFTTRSPTDLIVEGAPIRQIVVFSFACLLASLGRHTIIVSCVGDDTVESAEIDMGVRLVSTPQPLPFAPFFPPDTKSSG